MTEEWALLFKAIPSADPAAGCQVIFLGSVVLELDWGLAVLLDVPELIPQGEWSRRKQMNSQRPLCYQWQCLREQEYDGSSLGKVPTWRIFLRTLTIPYFYNWRREEYVPFCFTYKESEFSGPIESPHALPIYGEL